MKQMMAWTMLAGCGPAVADIEDGLSSSSPLQTSSPGDEPGPGDEPTVVWVDAEGTEVPEVVELLEGLAFEDEQGFFWGLDAGAEGVDAFIPFEGAGLVRVLYVDEACEDQRVVGDAILPPRYVMRGPYQQRSFVAQDDAVPQLFTYTYDRFEGQCSSGTLSASEALTWDEVIEVQIPDAYWVAPLHPERR